MVAGGRRRAPVEAAVGFGTARLEPDPARATGWTVLVDGVVQSYVDLADATHLPVPYLRWLAAVVDAAAAPRTALRVLHLGGGGLSLARYVAATRPGSAQQVVERDDGLLRLVLRVLPLSGTATVEIVVADAVTALDRFAAASFDLVVVDVYEGARMPAPVAGVPFTARAARLLARGGWYAVNVTDLPPLAFSRRLAATLREVHAEVCLLAEPGLLRGRRYGNLVLVATDGADELPVARLAGALTRRDPGGARVIHTTALADFVAGARPVGTGPVGGNPAAPGTPADAGPGDRTPA